MKHALSVVSHVMYISYLFSECLTTSMNSKFVIHNQEADNSYFFSIQEECGYVLYHFP